MAQKAYMSVPRESSNNYDELKEAVNHRYDIGEDTYRQSVSDTSQGVLQFNARTGDLLDKWARRCLTGKDWREQSEYLVQCRTMYSVDQGQEAMLEAGKLADDYMHNRNHEMMMISCKGVRNVRSEEITIDREDEIGIKGAQR